jgi:hypothetical protein
MLQYHIVNQMLSSQERAHAAPRRSASSQGIKRVFRLSSDRVAAREIGRR